MVHRYAASGTAIVALRESPFATFTAQVLNVSADGVLVNIAGDAESLQLNQEVAVEIDTIRAAGTIRHINPVLGGVTLGIHFTNVEV